MPHVATRDQLQLAYTDWGQGQPVVLVHAWGLNADMWTYQVPALLGDGRRCITYDRRGHGRSDRSGGGYDYDTLAGDLADLVDHLDLREAAFVAHSAGCGDVIRYLTTHGAGRTTRVVLLAPLTPLLMKTDDNPGGIEPEILARSAEALMWDIPKWCEDNAGGFFGQRQVSAGLVDWVARQIIDTPLRVLLETSAAFATTDFRAELPSIDVPTVLIHGTRDESAPIEVTGKPTADLIPCCEMRTYDGSGHGLFAADHERVNADIREFLPG